MRSTYIYLGYVLCGYIEHGVVIVVLFPLQAQVLHWKCFKKLQHVYGTQLWRVIEPTLDAIVAGIKVHI